MKRLILLIFSFFYFFELFLYGQSWPPQELKEMETKLLELKTQVSTLEEYSPKKFPEFEELERTNQVVEQIDFNKRKFDLLIEQYNLLEDRVFPFLLELNRKYPKLKNLITAKLREFSGNKAMSILLNQKEINHVALLIDRMQNELERANLIFQKKEIIDEIKDNLRSDNQAVDMSTLIEKWNDRRNFISSELTEELKKLNDLKNKKRQHESKIEEKRKEIETLRNKSDRSQDPFEALLFNLSAQVREIRLNGLEIPRLNTTKTFIYLSQSKIDTLKKKEAEAETEIAFLKKRKQKEFQKKLLKGIVVILIAFLLVMFLIRIFRHLGKRLISTIGKSEGLSPQRKQRYHTLSSIILSVIKITLWILAVLWVLGELNIDYAPFLVAAGGLSLAIGFGSQSLVKDMVSGFFILMEEQLALGDIVSIEGKSGVVEKISLRTIKLRALDGTVHIIPNGNISDISNLTHEWSGTIIEVGVSYEEDCRKVLAVLKNLCQEIFSDPEWKPMLIQEPVPQGILSFGDSALQFRILAKTLPGKQWDVDREIKNRIKERFDREGIEIPYPFMNVVDRTIKTTDQNPQSS